MSGMRQRLGKMQKRKTLLKHWLGNKRSQLSHRFEQPENWKFEIPPVPLQEKTSQDCGVFAFEFCKRVILNQKLNTPIVATNLRKQWSRENGEQPMEQGVAQRGRKRSKSQGRG